jgi:hypothetical protein
MNARDCGFAKRLALLGEEAMATKPLAPSDAHKQAIREGRVLAPGAPNLSQFVPIKEAAAASEFTKMFENAVKACESDPTGRAANEPGAKLDAGKPRVALVLRGFARALWEVSKVGTFGAKKYTPNGWMEVPEGVDRYDDAKMRHFLKEAMGEADDADSGIHHAAHEAWNALARLELLLRDQQAPTVDAVKRDLNL